MRFTELPATIDLSRGLVYQFDITDGDGVLLHRYIGISKNGAGRPRKDYAKNVDNLLAGRPYRKSQPDAFRAIHRCMADAVRRGDAITLSFLTNEVEDEPLARTEARLQHELGQGCRCPSLERSAGWNEPERRPLPLVSDDAAADGAEEVDEA